MVNDMPTCAECYWWSGNDSGEWATCELIVSPSFMSRMSSMPDAELEVEGCSGARAELRTAPDFGCVAFESKYDVTRIPCETGEHAAHLSEFQAEQCQRVLA